MKTARLIVANSQNDSNLLYLTEFFAPDPFVYFEVAGKKFLVMSDLEIDRATKVATVDRVLSFQKYVKALKASGVKQPKMSDVIRCVLREQRVKAVEVPASFPIGLAKALRGIRVTVKPDPFCPERQVKRADEVRKIAESQRLAELGMGAGINAIRMSRVGRGGFLYWRGEKLTSEHVQGVIGATIAGMGGVVGWTIVACGNQGCDPHEAGHGPMRAHLPIIIDIFPRSSTTGYWGDITRTVVRGRASETVKKMYATVFAAQKFAFGKLRDGVDGKTIHDGINDLFKRTGYKTGRAKGRMQGFFHGTGHSVGLDIHEAPGMGGISVPLKAGNVVTVEPGLYYWGVGGVRLEDTVVVQRNGMKNLTVFPKVLEV